MAIADVTIIPIGTETPSVSAYVADVQKILEGYQAEGKIKYQLTPMNTLIEGELSDLLQSFRQFTKRHFKKDCTEWQRISVSMTGVTKNDA